MNNKYGLSAEALGQINKVFATFDQVDEIILYGSRAKGNFKPGSDIDLTIKGEKLDLITFNNITRELDLLPLPYQFDVSIYDHISKAELLDHIARVGKVFYKKAFGTKVTGQKKRVSR